MFVVFYFWYFYPVFLNFQFELGDVKSLHHYQIGLFNVMGFDWILRLRSLLCQDVKNFRSALAYDILDFPVGTLFSWFEMVKWGFGLCFRWLNFLNFSLHCFFVFHNYFINFWKFFFLHRSFQFGFNILYCRFCFSYCLVTRLYMLHQINQMIFQFREPVVNECPVKITNGWFQFQF